MSKIFYSPARALTVPLIAREACGPSCHPGVTTNLEWCEAECKQQNKTRGKDYFEVVQDEDGNVWIALKDRAPANWSFPGVRKA